MNLETLNLPIICGHEKKSKLAPRAGFGSMLIPYWYCPICEPGMKTSISAKWAKVWLQGFFILAVAGLLLLLAFAGSQ